MLTENFLLRARRVKKFANHRAAVRRCCENLKNRARGLVRERIATSILEKLSGRLNYFSFLTGLSIKVKSTNNCKSAILICLSAFSSE